MQRQAQFDAVLGQIQQAKQQALQQINQTLVKLYWNVGKYISRKVDQEGWGKSVVEELATFITIKEPYIKGFSARNIWTVVISILGLPGCVVKNVVMSICWLFHVSVDIFAHPVIRKGLLSMENGC